MISSCLCRVAVLVGAAVEKLDPREIKKMNAKQLKDYLKERGLSLHGQKKELMDRLIAYETGGSSG